MGYAGNKEPQFIMPSAIAVKETAKVGSCFSQEFILDSKSPFWPDLCCIYNIKILYTRIESSKVGDERRATRGMEDLDFHIGDEAMNVGNPYAVKVSIDEANSQD